MTEKIVGAVARVLAQQFDKATGHLGDSLIWEDWADDAQQQFRDDATAAITAFLKAVQEDEETIKRVARGLCQEKCAYRGEPPCWQIEGEWPPETCDEPGCMAEATAALSALSRGFNYDDK